MVFFPQKTPLCWTERPWAKGTDRSVCKPSCTVY